MKARDYLRALRVLRGLRGLRVLEVELSAEFQQTRGEDGAWPQPRGAVGAVVPVACGDEVRVEHVVQVDVRLQAAPTDLECSRESQIDLMRALVVLLAGSQQVDGDVRCT